VLADARVVGEVTSGTFSFTLGCGIATASIAPDVADDARVFVDVRGAAVAAERTPLPFYRRPKGNAKWPTSPLTASPPPTSG
jgi:aminomethyltransferase